MCALVTGVQTCALPTYQEEVANVLHPGLPSFGSHEQWRKDFTGSCGLFSIELKSVGDAAQDMLRAKIFCESLRLFRIGGSWGGVDRSEEHTSELQSLMRISYAVFCLKTKNITASVTPTLLISIIL